VLQHQSTHETSQRASDLHHKLVVPDLREQGTYDDNIFGPCEHFKSDSSMSYMKQQFEASSLLCLFLAVKDSG